jgi:hypothetical protein
VIEVSKKNSIPLAQKINHFSTLQKSRIDLKKYIYRVSQLRPK